MKTYIAIDQYGQTHSLKTKYPRKELMEMFGYSSAQKIYRDTPNGTKHTGYYVGGLWLSLFKIQPIDEVQS